MFDINEELKAKFKRIVEKAKSKEVSGVVNYKTIDSYAADELCDATNELIKVSLTHMVNERIGGWWDDSEFDVETLLGLRDKALRDNDHAGVITYTAILIARESNGEVEKSKAVVCRTKMQQHEDYMAIAAGPKLKAVMPCCRTELEFLVPTNPHETWDSLMECPNCAVTLFKVAKSQSIKLWLKGVGHVNE